MRYLVLLALLLDCVRGERSPGDHLVDLVGPPVAVVARPVLPLVELSQLDGRVGGLVVPVGIVDRGDDCGKGAWNTSAGVAMI